MRMQLWQDMHMQDFTSEALRHRLEMWNELNHLTIAASAGHFTAMHDLRTLFEKGYVSRELIDSTLTAYNNSCAEMRSEARDAYMRHFY